MAKVNRVGRRLAYRARKDTPFDEYGAISPTENEHHHALVKRRTNECDDPCAGTINFNSIEPETTGARFKTNSPNVDDFSKIIYERSRAA